MLLSHTLFMKFIKDALGGLI